jgi:hypothetical protein
VPSQQSQFSQQQQQQQQSIAEDEEWAASEQKIAAAATAAGISTYSTATATTARSAAAAAAAANEAARLRRYDEQSHDEGPLAYVRRRSSQLWLFFPHVELVFLLAAIEGATAAQVRCLQILLIACTFDWFD